MSPSNHERENIYILSLNGFRATSTFLRMDWALKEIKINRAKTLFTFSTSSLKIKMVG
jgi:hypothetical protein